MVFDVIGLVFSIRDTVNLAYELCQLPSQSRQNAAIAYQLWQKLRLIDNHMQVFRSHRDVPSLSNSALPDIQRDVDNLNKVIQRTIECQRSPSFDRLSNAAEYQRQLNQALQVTAQCQSRIETHLLLNEMRSYFTEEFQNLGDAIDKIAENGKTGLTGDAERNFNLLVKVYDHFGPSLINETASAVPEGNACSDILDEYYDLRIDDDERTSVSLIGQVPSAVTGLIKDAAQTGLSSERQRELVHRVTHLWSGWQIEPHRLIYDNDEFGVARELGHGAMGVVHAATFLMEGDGASETPRLPVAVKRINLGADSDSQEAAVHLLRELFIQLTLNHPCVLRTYGACWPNLFQDKGDKNRNRAEGQQTARLVMERMTHNLGVALNDGLLVDFHDKFCVLFDVAAALFYLHHHRIVHRDLKPENVLLNFVEGKQVGFAKLSDFGCSRRSHDEKMTMTYNLTTQGAGTPFYLPPEALKDVQHCHTSRAWDVWAYGLLMCRVLARPEAAMKLKMWNLSEDARTGRIGREARRWAESIVDSRQRALAIQCLQDDATKRPTMLHVNLFQNGELDVDGLKVRHLPSSLLHGHVDRVMNSQETAIEKAEALLFYQYAKRAELAEARQLKPSPIQKVQASEPVDSERSSAQTGGSGDMSVKRYEEVQEVRNSRGEEMPRSHSSGSGERSYGIRPPQRVGSGSTKKTRSGLNGLKDSLGSKLRGLSSGGFEEGSPFHTKVPGGGLFSRRISHGLTIDDRKFRECNKDSKDGNREKPSLETPVKEGSFLTSQESLRSSTQSESSMGIDRNESDPKETVGRIRNDAMYQNDKEAMRKLGYCYEVGHGVERNNRLAKEWYEDALRNGDAVAGLRLGMMYSRGDGVRKNPRQAFALYSKSAEIGCVKALVKLGECHEEGHGTKIDILEALRCFEHAEEAGDLTAKVKLGEIWAFGRGVEADDAKAVSLFQEAYEGGSVVGCYRLGECYQVGRGVNQNTSKAIELFTAAGTKGYAQSWWKIGECYEHFSGGGRKHFQQAREMYQKARDHGYAPKLSERQIRRGTLI